MPARLSGCTQQEAPVHKDAGCADNPPLCTLTTEPCHRRRGRWAVCQAFTSVSTFCRAEWQAAAPSSFALQPKSIVTGCCYSIAAVVLESHPSCNISACAPRVFRAACGGRVGAAGGAVPSHTMRPAVYTLIQQPLPAHQKPPQQTQQRSQLPHIAQPPLPAQTTHPPGSYLCPGSSAGARSGPALPTPPPPASPRRARGAPHTPGARRGPGRCQSWRGATPSAEQEGREKVVCYVFHEG